MRELYNEHYLHEILKYSQSLILASYAVLICICMHALDVVVTSNL